MLNKCRLNSVFHEKTKDGDVFYDVHSRLIKDRVIFLSEPLTQETAGNIAALLFMLDKESNEKISLWLNTPGGDARGFFAIYDMMHFIKSPIETICIGMAASAGALLLASGTKGKRFATKNSHIMIHQVQAAIAPGSGTDIEIEAKEIAALKRQVTELLARHTGQTYEKIFHDCEHDYQLTAEQALEYGLIDKILPYDKPLPPLKSEKTKLVKSKSGLKPSKTVKTTVKRNK